MESARDVEADWLVRLGEVEKGLLVVLSCNLSSRGLASVSPVVQFNGANLEVKVLRDCISHVLVIRRLGSGGMFGAPSG